LIPVSRKWRGKDPIHRRPIVVIRAAMTEVQQGEGSNHRALAAACTEVDADF
jgi:hypothetical protein